MKLLIKQAVERLPGPLPLLVQDAARYVRHPKIRRERATHRRVLNKLEEPGRVAQGPFRGMSYISRAYGSMVLPKILGTYERELEGAVERICRAGCDRIVDIGAAEGYYGVGIAIRNPEAEVICFESSGSARFYLRRLARQNGVLDRIAIEGECSLESLAASLQGARRAAVICDCEGAEDLLLRPDVVAPLRRSLILVETHDGMVEGVSGRLAERFAPTHAIEVIDSQERGLHDLPAGCDLSPEEATVAMDEYRRWARWILMVPETFGGPSDD